MSRRVGHNEVIGVCRTGLDAEGLGRDHWNEMLAYHRKPITHWHPLLEVRARDPNVGSVGALAGILCLLTFDILWTLFFFFNNCFCFCL